jgi:hypothetical protein
MTARGRARDSVSWMTPDRTQLRAISEHVLYEAEMLAGVWPALDAGQLQPEYNAVVRNGLVEAFAIHARGLSDFLFSPPKDDDAAAEHFFAPGAWVELRGEQISHELRAVRRRTNKEIAHLTYSRLNVPDASKSWMQQAIVLEIQRVFFRFVEHVDPELVADDFKPRAEALRVRPGLSTGTRRLDPTATGRIATSSLRPSG